VNPAVVPLIDQRSGEKGMPGSLETLPSILQGLDGAALSPAEAISELLVIKRKRKRN